MRIYGHVGIRLRSGRGPRAGRLWRLRRLRVRDALSWGPFDLVLLDPPYAFGAEPVEELLQNLAQQGLLAPGAYALFEHAAADAGAHPAGFETVREKRYGITSVDLLRWVGDDDGEGDSAGTDADNNDATTFQEDAHE